MSKVNVQLLAKLPVLKKFHRLAWSLSGVNIAVVPPDIRPGVWLASSRTITRFCAQLQKQARGMEACLKCDYDHFRQVLAERKPIRYRCHAGLTEFIIPVLLDGEIIALLQCGQILDAPLRKTDWTRTRETLAAAGVKTEPLEKFYHRIRAVPPHIQEDLIMLLELFGNYLAQTQNQLLLAKETRSSQIVERARSHIRNHFAESIALDDVARAAYTSKRNLCRVFGAETGATVLGFIHETRVAQACRRLEWTDLSCAEIALESGFGGVQQFNRVFRKFRRMTPLAWRKRHAFR